MKPFAGGSRRSERSCGSIRTQLSFQAELCRLRKTVFQGPPRFACMVIRTELSNQQTHILREDVIQGSLVPAPTSLGQSRRCPFNIHDAGVPENKAKSSCSTCELETGKRQRLDSSLDRISRGPDLGLGFMRFIMGLRKEPLEGKVRNLIWIRPYLTGAFGSKFSVDHNLQFDDICQSLTFPSPLRIPSCSRRMSQLLDWRKEYATETSLISDNQLGAIPTLHPHKVCISKTPTAWWGKSNGVSLTAFISPGNSVLIHRGTASMSSLSVVLSSKTYVAEMERSPGNPQRFKAASPEGTSGSGCGLPKLELRNDLDDRNEGGIPSLSGTDKEVMVQP
nr:hypothetical protein Iba_chr03aCG3910 [Ipomoea batatas]